VFLDPPLTIPTVDTATLAAVQQLYFSIANVMKSKSNCQCENQTLMMAKFNEENCKETFMED
jgi:hypothetical protein